MLAFFRSLISPVQTTDASVLQAKLQSAARECDFWHGLYLEERKAKKAIEIEREAERTRNRLREDDLLNNILRNLNQPLPRFREEIEPDKTEETSAAQNEDELLEARAVDYLEQTYGEYTTDQYEETLKSMKANSSYWLSN